MTDSYVFHGSAEKGAAKKVHKLLKKDVAYNQRKYSKEGMQNEVFV